MLLKRCLAVLAVATLAMASSAVACGASTNGNDGGTDSSADGKSKDGGSDTGKDADCRSLGDSAPVLTALSVTSKGASDASPPIALVPAFSPDVHDYYVRCAEGTNALEVSMTPAACDESSLSKPQAFAAKPTQQTLSVSATENQAIVAVATRGSNSAEYWVRCLPADFPPIEMEHHPEAGAPTPGYYLLGNLVATGSKGGYAMVLNGDGVPVWYHHEPSGSVSDVDHVLDASVSYITNNAAPAVEVFQIASPLVATEAGPPSALLDVHELQVLANGDYVVISNPNTTGVDLTGLTVHLSDGGTGPGGPGSNINDCTIIEFNPTTGTADFTWTASAHFDPAKDCTEPYLAPPLPDGGTVIDAFHCNSVDVDPANGNLLVSARQMDSVFYIERSTGNVLWKMGGSDASVDDATYIPVASPFFGEHDVRLQPGWSSCGGQISMFDDETYGKGSARGVLYDVTVGAGADGGCDGGAAGATVAEQHVGISNSQAAGSFRISPDKSRVIGWGLGYPKVIFTEFDEKGHDLLDFISFTEAPPPFPMQSFRAIKVPLTAFDLNAMRLTAGVP